MTLTEQVNTLPKYRSHQLVRAAKIVGFTHDRQVIVALLLDGASPMPVKSDWVARHAPQPGGYVVVPESQFNETIPSMEFWKADEFEAAHNLEVPETLAS